MKRTVADRVLKTLMIAVTGLWGVFFVSGLLSAVGLLPVEDSMWRGVMAILAVLALPLLAAILTVLGFCRYLLRKKDGAENRRSVSPFAMITAFVLAVITIVCFIACWNVSSMNIDLPYTSTNVSSQLMKMFLAFGCLTPVPLFVDFVFRIFIRQADNKGRARVSAGLRTTAIVLTTLIVAGVLLIPTPSGTYNDGGSKIYEAVLYEAVDWHRTQKFDGTPVEVEKQRLRVYFFPFNCYDYTAKWEWKH